MVHQRHVHLEQLIAHEARAVEDVRTLRQVAQEMKQQTGIGEQQERQVDVELGENSRGAVPVRLRTRECR